LHIDEDIASAWGVILGEAEQKGITISAVDGLLGATAVQYNLTVVTRNVEEIQSTGARILNPREL
jgi:hypothetical protein